MNYFCVFCEGFAPFAFKDFLEFKS